MWDILHLSLCIDLVSHDSIHLASKVHLESISLTPLLFLFYFFKRANKIRNKNPKKMTLLSLERPVFENQSLSPRIKLLIGKVQ